MANNKMKYQVDESLMEAIKQVESGGNPNAVSPAGAKGLYQIMPATAKNPGMGIKPLQDWSEGEQHRFATDYMNVLINRYDGDTEKALAAYNGGAGNVDKYGGPIPGNKENQSYAIKVRKAFDALSPIKDAEAGEGTTMPSEPLDVSEEYFKQFEPKQQSEVKSEPLDVSEEYFKQFEPKAAATPEQPKNGGEIVDDVIDGVKYVYDGVQQTRKIGPYVDGMIGHGVVGAVKGVAGAVDSVVNTFENIDDSLMAGAGYLAHEAGLVDASMMPDVQPAKNTFSNLAEEYLPKPANSAERVAQTVGEWAGASTIGSPLSSIPKNAALGAVGGTVASGLEEVGVGEGASLGAGIAASVGTAIGTKSAGRVTQKLGITDAAAAKNAAVNLKDLTGKSAQELDNTVTSALDPAKNTITEPTLAEALQDKQVAGFQRANAPRMSSLTDKMDSNLKSQEEALHKIKSPTLNDGATASDDEIGATIRDKVQTKHGEAREKTTKAFAKVDEFKDGKVYSPVNKFEETLSTFYPLPETTPSSITKLVGIAEDRAREGNGKMTFEDIRALRKEIANTEHSLRTGAQPDRNAATALGKMKKQIDDQIKVSIQDGLVGTEHGAAYNEALATRIKQGADFEEGANLKVSKLGRDRTEIVDDNRVGKTYFGTNSKKEIDNLVKAVGKKEASAQAAAYMSKKANEQFANGMSESTIETFNKKYKNILKMPGVQKEVDKVWTAKHLGKLKDSTKQASVGNEDVISITKFHKILSDTKNVERFKSTLEPEEFKKFEALAEDIKRSKFAESANGAHGSTTADNLLHTNQIDDIGSLIMHPFRSTLKLALGKGRAGTSDYEKLLTDPREFQKWLREEEASKMTIKGTASSNGRRSAMQSLNSIINSGDKNDKQR